LTAKPQAARHFKRSAPVLTTRRQVLVTISQLAAAATLAACTRSGNQATGTSGGPDLELLASVAYDILPYAELTPDLYVKAAQQILDLHDAGMPDGLKKLRDASNNVPWKDLAEPDRVAILTSMQDTPFFEVLRSNTLLVLLREPATFAVVGYGGSAMQFGGYLHRGFNDISWLPASKNN
jgi:hypothetical protein